MPFGPTGYEGPGTSFSGISADLRTGSVNFGPALAAGATGYFGLEDSPAAGTVSALDTLGAGNQSEDNHQCSKGPYPVNCATGNFWHTFSDRVVPGRGPALDLERTYNSLDAATDGPFGFGWSSSYAMQVTVDDTAAATVHQENGSQVRFVPMSRTAYVAPARVFATLRGGTYGTFTFVRRQRETFSFAFGRLTSIRDLNGYTISIGYANGQVATATDPAGRSLSFGYGPSGRVESVTDPAGYVLHYSYDAAGNLVSSTDVRGQTTRCTYDGAHHLLTMSDPRGGVVTNTYDASARVVAQRDPLGRTTTFAYSGTTTTVTDPRATSRCSPTGRRASWST